MDNRSRIADRLAAWTRRLHRTRLECRECQVICEKVISPQHCLDSGCSSVYVYEEEGTRMFGCIHKVFLPELDMAMFSSDGGGSRAPDRYGALRLHRTPRRQCRVAIEQGYPAAAAATACVNPTFFHQPTGAPEERMRFTTNLSSEPEPQD